MKKSWNKFFLISFVLLLLLALAACQSGPSETAASAGNEQTAAAPGGSEAAQTEAQANTHAAAPVTTRTTAKSTQAASPAGKDKLVVYFSATGNTRAVAEKIAAITDADLYEIQAAQPYTDADLNWHDSSNRTTREQNDKNARPEIGSEAVSLAGYTKIYIGYPIWWGEEPRILDTFVESYDFDGVTLIPFCTSSSSGIGRSGRNLAENAGSGSWLDGRRFGAGASESELRDWISSLG